MKAKKYIPADIEQKWRDKWDESGLFKIDLEKASNKKYLLVEFTYPSGDLHIGHWFTFSLPDMYAKYNRMKGFDVFFPNGFDSFGLPAENAAIKNKVHPQDWTESNIARMKQQFKLMGASYNWDHEVITSHPEYYRWNQWIFLQMLEKGLAYRGKALSNWCENCQTVLANEGVEAGKCWRCGTEVIQKEVEQWFLAITKYADRLIWPEDTKLDWPESVKVGQNNWIGKKTGINITYEIQDSSEKITVFTTRPDTNFGATFIAVAPENELIKKIVTPEQKAAVEEYLNQTKKKSELERKESKEKTGVFTGAYAINSLNNKKMPIWVSDFVLMGFGTGALVGVPGHDKRDFEFADKFGLEVIRVVVGSDKDDSMITKIDQVQEEEGVMVNSDFLNGLDIHEATEKIMDYIESKGYGERTVIYHIHDWSISRQRYWGTPVPVIHCPKCGVVPVPEKQLPVELPYEVDFTPTGKPPLASAEEWIKVKCPKCSEDALRDTETMDTFFDSSWYFLRYIDPVFEQGPFNARLSEKIMPVDVYFGGAEHTLGHTLYARFFTKFFKELGLTNLDEFAQKRIQHGIVLGPDGNKMSKSKGNVINPDEQVKKYGADTVRLYLAFMMPYEATGPWDTERVWGPYRFLQRVWELSEKVVETEPDKTSLVRMNQTNKRVSNDLEQIKLNTAIAGLMEWLNFLNDKPEVTKIEYKNLLLMLAPFAPHIAEELWEAIGESYSIHTQAWPELDEKYLEAEEFTVVVQINGKVRDNLSVSKDMIEDQAGIEKLALESPKVQKFIENKTPSKIIYIKGKILNLVI